MTRNFQFILLAISLIIISISNYACDTALATQKKKTDLSLIEQHLMSSIFDKNKPRYYDVEDRMKHHGAIGFSLTTIKDFKIEATKGYGYCRKADEIFVDKHSIFRVGSISKSLTSIVVLKLQEKGQLDIDTDIRQYLKTWKLPESQYIRNTSLTLRHLLSHRSGLKQQQAFKRGVRQGFLKGESLPSLNQALDGETILHPVTFVAEPGSKYSYSNQGYNLIQKVLEDITGKVFEELAEELVLRPFAMNNSTFKTVYPDDSNSNYCYAYRDQKVHEGYYENTILKCAGGLFSTSEDLAKFALNVANINNSNNNFLSPKIARQFFDGDVYGLGFDLISKDSLFLFSHSGRSSGYYSFMAMDPDKGNGFTMLVNTDYVGDFFSEMLRSVSKTFGWNLWDPKLISSIDIEPSDYQGHIGEYIATTEDGEYKMTIIQKEQQFYCLEHDDEETYEYPLIPIDKGVFIDGIDGNKIEFKLEKDQVVSFLYDNEYVFVKN